MSSISLEASKTVARGDAVTIFSRPSKRPIRSDNIAWPWFVRIRTVLADTGRCLTLHKEPPDSPGAQAAPRRLSIDFGDALRYVKEGVPPRSTLAP
ncbi:MAG: hypothetical protein ABI699_16590 [Caldimonas sp.]